MSDLELQKRFRREHFRAQSKATARLERKLATQRSERAYTALAFGLVTSVGCALMVAFVVGMS